LAENGSGENYGLANDLGAVALRGGAFTGRGGTSAYGIYNSGTTLEAESVTALGENGSYQNYGLWNYNAATALRGGAFTGRGGTSAYGIYNVDGTAKADSSQFTGSSNGLYQNGGTVSLGVSQLDGGATRTSGTLTCFQVYDGNYAAYTCP
jgi:hypothetical protein